MIISILTAIPLHNLRFIFKSFVGHDYLSIVGFFFDLKSALIPERVGKYLPSDRSVKQRSTIVVVRILLMKVSTRMLKFHERYLFKITPKVKINCLHSRI